MTGKDFCWKKKKAPPGEPKLCPESIQNKRNEFSAANFGNRTVSASLLAEKHGEKTEKNASPRASSLCTMTEKAGWYV